MKNALLSLAITLITTTLYAQKTVLIQQCMVREQNSNKRPLADAQVIFEDAVPAFSGQDGKVRLAFQHKIPGTYAFLTEVTKAGYELVNKTELEQVKLSNTNQLGSDIILARAGTIDAAKKQYYGISDKALLAGFEKEKRRLRGELSATRLSEQQYEERYKQVQDQYDNQKKELDRLAEKFARVNFDDVDSLFREALELFKAGKIDAAITKLEGANPAKRTEQIIRDEKRIADAQDELNAQKQALAKDKQDQIAMVRLLADMYGLKFDLAKAEPQYDQLLRLDSTNLTILSDAADFYRQNHRYDNALRLLPKIIAHPQAEDWQKANAYIYSSDMYTAIGQLDLALQACLAAQKTYVELLNANSANPGFKKGLAISYEKLGLTYTELGNLDTALTYFEEETKLFETLYTNYPQRLDIKKGLAIAYEKFGQTHAIMGKMDQALTYFKQYNYLVRDLYSTYPQNVDFKNGLAISCEKLGMVYSALGNLDTALTYFEEETTLFEELYQAYPQHVDIKKGLAIADEKIGETHTALGNMDKALTYFDRYNQLVTELCATYPQNVDFKNGLAISCEKLGSTHASLGNLDKALTYFEDEIKLFKELCTAYPQHVSFKNGLAFAYAQLAQFYEDQKADRTKSRFYYEQCQILWEELAKDYPRFVEFQANLERVQIALADLDKATDPVSLLRTRIQNEPDTLTQYQLYGTLCDTLRQKAQNDPQYKADLADALNSRAWIGFFLGKFEDVEADIREGIALGTDNMYLVTHLAPALLLQGKYKEAVAEYKKWKDKPYGEQGQSTYRKVFLGDLDAFEKAGIIPSARAVDVAAARNILSGA